LTDDPPRRDEDAAIAVRASYTSPHDWTEDPVGFGSERLLE